jgi:hypothetical protein
MDHENGSQVDESADATTPNRVKFDLIKSPHFRVIFAEGAFGGISPGGHINMALFNERFPLPTHVEYVVEGGQLGAEILDARIGRDGIIREVETEVVMTLDGAKKLHTWLGKKIADLTMVLEQVAKKEGG